MKPESGHYYSLDGKPAHFQPKKDGSGNRPTTVADCRKLGLLPSPTTILKLLNKPALIEWLIRQAVNAVVTSPDVPGEGLDAKIARVLDEERQQDQESQIARDLGTDIHEAIELALNDVEWNQELRIYVAPVIDAVMKLGRIVSTEKILVGRGCAGRTDCIVEDDDFITVVDFKTAKKLPDRGAWPEHRMQAGFYADSLGNTGDKRVRTAILYIEKEIPGRIAVFTDEQWQSEYQKFQLLLKYWYLSNDVAMPEGLK